MDEEYTVVGPLVLWRRRLLIGAIIIAFFCLVLAVEMLYNTWRVKSGPSAWFMVVTPITRGQPYAAHEQVISEGYATEGACNDELKRLPGIVGGPISSCRRLLLSDATQMRR